MGMFVRCSKCQEDHKPKEMETLNIEEDMQGRDLLTYVCPVTQEITKAYVLQK